MEIRQRLSIFLEQVSLLFLAVIHLQGIKEPSPQYGVSKSNLKMIAWTKGPERCCVLGLISISLDSIRHDGIGEGGFCPQISLLKCYSVVHVRTYIQQNKVSHWILTLLAVQVCFFAQFFRSFSFTQTIPIHYREISLAVIWWCHFGKIKFS